jgi:hypothetical protein
VIPTITPSSLIPSATEFAAFGLRSARGVKRHLSKMKPVPTISPRLFDEQVGRELLQVRYSLGAW